MSTTVKACLAAGGCVGLVAAGAFAAPAGARTAYEDAGAGLMFMQSNDLEGNGVAVSDRCGDSALAEAGRPATSRLGGRLDAPDFDQLAFQGSVANDREI